MFKFSRFGSRLATLGSRSGSLSSSRGLPAVLNAVPSRALSKSPADPTPLTETVRDFLEPEDFYNLLNKNGMNFFTGVPDSLLKDFCAYVSDTAPPENHIITSNEGASVGVAAGYHLATGDFPVVYMQNSGFGNAVNPLLSLADPKVYSIPMLLLIGWRGEPGKKDEPQHLVQGKVMSSLLTDCGLNFEVLPDFLEGAEETIASAKHHLQTRQSPYALLVKRQCFSPYKMKSVAANTHDINREEALNIILKASGPYDVFVGTTGFTSRELYEARVANGQGHGQDFLTVGCMGHATSIAMGISLRKPSRQVITLDGDGAALMHMGSMAVVGSQAGSNYKHILINNGAHDSVGGQPTVGFKTDFPAIARACGYKWADTCSARADVEAKTRQLLAASGPAFLEIKVNKGARKDLGRPKTSPVQNKEQFMKFMQS